MGETEHGQLNRPVIVQRWTRYGHDRAYVQLNGAQVGYRDLRTSEIHCQLDQHVGVVEDATASLLRRQAAATDYRPRHAERSQSAAVAGPASGPDADPPAVAGQRQGQPPAAALLPDRDLALVAAGAAARAQAIALRDAAPVRTLLSRALGRRTAERAWRIGADAEVEVGRRLSRLGPSWRLLHAVPIGAKGSDIDHVLIGPAGVFTVNTKHHPAARIWVRGDTCKVAGQNQHYVRNSRYEARQAATLLSAATASEVGVRGLIVLVGVRELTVKQQPPDGTVAVLTGKALKAHLRSLPAILDEASVARIYEAARHLASWQPTTVRHEQF